MGAGNSKLSIRQRMWMFLPLIILLLVAAVGLVWSSPTSGGGWDAFLPLVGKIGGFPLQTATLGPSPTSTLGPSPTSTQDPIDTPTPSPTQTPGDTQTPTQTPSLGPSPTPSLGPSPTATQTPASGPSPSPSPSGAPTTTSTPTPSPMPSVLALKVAAAERALLGETIVYSIGFYNYMAMNAQVVVTDMFPVELQVTQAWNLNCLSGDLSILDNTLYATVTVPSDSGVCQLVVWAEVVDACNCYIVNEADWRATWPGGSLGGRAESNAVFLSDDSTPTPTPTRTINPPPTSSGYLPVRHSCACYTEDLADDLERQIGGKKYQAQLQLVEIGSKAAAAAAEDQE